MSDQQPTFDSAGVDTNIKPGTPPPPQAPAAPLVYRQISGWAIAGFALGSLFTLLVVLCAFISFYQGAPFFIYQWLIGIAILGVFVSLYAQRHVRTAEGTLSGARLAQWGFRLSLVSGMMYLSYYFVTGFAVTRQANSFLMEEAEDAGFFPRLLKGADNPIELNKAFLLTQTPNARNGRPEDEKSMRKNHDISGKDGASGLLTQFRELSPLPRILFGQLAKDAEITPKEVLDWKYEKRSYMIERVYRIKTKEIELDFKMVVYSAEAEEKGQARKWFLVLPLSQPVPGTVKLTKVGEGMSLLRQRANEKLAKIMEKVADGTAGLNLENLDRTPWPALSSKEFKERRERMHQAFTGKDPERVLGFQPTTQAELPPGKWEQIDGKIRVHLMGRFALASDLMQKPAFQCDAVFALETNLPIDPATVKDDLAVDWNLVSVNITSMALPDDTKSPPLQKLP